MKATREDDEEKKMAHVNEFNITKDLNHINVVRSIAIFNNDIKGEIHQVMDYIEGKEVLDHIAE